MVSALRKQKDSERKEITQASMLEAAARVFVECGYHKTLISDIVDEAGVGQGTLYRHFKDKREVFETLIDQFIIELLGEFSEMSATLPKNIEEYRQASRSAILRVAKKLEENRPVVQLILREAKSIDRQFEEKMATIYGQFAKLAKFYLDYAIENGFARPCQTDVIANSLVGIGIHLIGSWVTNDFKGQALDELITEINDFAFKGIECRH